MISQKGYSLIEIVIGLVIITLFLLTTGSLINASYTNYHLILERNEAMSLAINKMEEVLCSGDVEVSDVGYKEKSLDARVKVENVEYGEGENRKKSDKVFLVTVEVSYSKKPTDENKYVIQLQSLKVKK